MILVGPAGWSYPDWEGRVYPRAKPRGFHPLAFLAPFIDCVELNSSFYTLPRAEHASRWASLVEDEPGFRFVTKLLQDFTHEPVPEDHGVWEQKMTEWRAGVEPLRRRGLLAAVLVQFPAGFAEGPANVRRLGTLAGLLDGLPKVLEVRHRSWFDPPALSEVAGLGYSLAHIDLPASWDHPPKRFRCTGPIGYLRLHGRNDKDWFCSSAGRDDRYNYLYTPPELGELAYRADAISKETDETFVVTNNHFEGQALANAIELKWLLGGRQPVPAPAELVEAFPHLRPLTEVRGQSGLFEG
ncbi:MAG: DUF72 domain-containing protein [Planctomycetota bacterium]|nr:DUF72 domain-containing protein [Planctomycetota bacterium]